MPRALICVDTEQLAWEQYEDAPLQDGQFLVRNEYGAAKHGTEMSHYKGYGNPRGRYDPQWQTFMPGDAVIGYPSAVGNMNVGVVIEVGPDVQNVKTGQRVATMSGFRETNVLTAEQEGGRWWRMPESMSWRSAMCLDPMSFGFSAVRDGHVRIGDAVAIFSLGAIGLMAVQCAKLAGASLVIALDPLANRRAVAETLGADVALDPTSCDAGMEIRRLTDKRGADVAIDYSGNLPALQHAIRGVAFGGNVVCGAYPPAYPAGLDFGAEAHFNIPNIIFSRSCSQPDRDHPRWDSPRVVATCWDYLVAGRATGEGVIDPVVPYEQLIDEYPKIASDPASNIKMGTAY